MSDGRRATGAAMVRSGLLVLCVIALVCVPFVLIGEAYALPLLESRKEQAWALTLIAIALLAADAVAPVPSTIVLLFLAAKAGWVAGVVGGTIGLSAGVVVAAWLGRSAVGRLAPAFLPDAELARLREALHRRLFVTLACLRSVPILAETSVILAAASGVPVRTIFVATLLPNVAIAVIYAVAADDSFATACIAFGATLAVSFIAWWLIGRGKKQSPTK